MIQGRVQESDREQDPDAAVGRSDLTAVDSFAEELGSCVEGSDLDISDTDGDIAPPSDRFHRIEGWHRFGTDAELAFETTDYTLGPSSPPMVRLSLTSSETLRGEEQETMVVKELQATRMREAQAAGFELYLGGQPSSLDSEYLPILLAAVRDDVAAFVGECEHEWATRPFTGFADSRDESPAETFLAMVNGEVSADDYTTWETGPPVEDARDPAVWDDLDPDERHLDPELTPDEVLEQTAGVGLFLDFEAAEMEPGRLLCVRSERARSGCFDLASVGRNLFTFQAFTDVPLKLVLVEERDDGTTVDLDELGELSPDVLREVAGSATSDDPLVVKVAGLDHPQVQAGGQQVQLETTTLTNVETAQAEPETG